MYVYISIHVSIIECTSPGSAIPSPEACSKLINYPLTDGRTLLHVAVEFQSDPDVLLLLLECGCDPAVSDSDDVTPYQLAIRLNKKAMANVFRRFRFHQPDRYDYDKARVSIFAFLPFFVVVVVVILNFSID
ncbi:unnamed protein product [Trichobilharzia regenti]|nr:unnamed protein product [Trichobilharzia regenti]